MKITFIGNNFPDASNPYRGSYNFERAIALSERGHEYNVFAPRAWLERLRTPECARPYPDTKFINGPVYYPTYYHTTGVLHRFHSATIWWSLRQLLLNTQRQFKPDVIVSYFAIPDGVIAHRVAEYFNVPHVYISGGSDVLLIDQPWRMRQTMQVLDGAQKIATVSDGLRQKQIELGVSAEKIEVIRQGINPQHYSTGDRDDARQRLSLPLDRPILVWVGRMAPVKGLPDLIAALEHLRQSMPDVLLVLIGDGPQRTMIEQLIESKGLTDHVLLTGGLPNKELPSWYQAADISVLSSLSEGIPNSLRESLACGTGFVSTDVGSIREIAVAGYSDLVEPQNPEALATAVHARLSGPGAKGTFAVRSWQQTAVDDEALFQAAIDERKQKARDHA